jgi:hypothetical protein
VSECLLDHFVGLGPAGIAEFRPGGKLGLEPVAGLVAELDPCGLFGWWVVLGVARTGR